MKKDKKKLAPEKSIPKDLNYQVLNNITERAFFMALRMIDMANSRPDIPKGEPKVGGHPSACASSQHILAAIHLVLREPEDYFAFKPHISPLDHALNCLLHNFRNENNDLFSKDERKLAMQHLRHYSREGHPVFQSYHAESDPDGYRYFPSGSVGIPPVNALYTSLGYHFAKDHKFELNEDPTFWCVMGDSEFREGSLHEAMPDAGERQLGNLVWIVDYNRQNLDGTRVLNEKALGGSDADRIVKLAEANGWEGIKLKHGKLREKLFKKPGGEEFRRVLDEEFTDFEYQAVLAANKAELTRKVLEEKSTKLKSWLKNYSDEDIQAAFTNLAGHDLESLVEALKVAKTDRTRPTLIVAYTIKGRGLSFQALSGNHSAMPEESELKELAVRLGASFDDPFEDFEKDTEEEKYLAKKRESLLSGIDQILGEVAERKRTWLEEAQSITWPVDFDISALKFNPVAHTQWMWGQIAAKLDRLARGDRGTKNDNLEQGWGQVARFFLTMAPDVGSSTNTSPNMNGKLYGDVGQKDFEAEYGAKDEKAPDIMPHSDARTGHIRFEIAEGNCMSAAGSIGKFFHYTGIPFFPAMTIYDFFVKRAHDQFYYNLYWHSSFATIGTPSGITLAPEGAQHSWKSDFQIPNCVTWEPCFAKELEWILADGLRRHFTKEDKNRESLLIRCVTKGLTQKDFVERLKKQKRFEASDEAEIMESIRQDTLKGGYALVDYRGYEDYTPGDNVIHVFSMGALVAEALKASDQLYEKGIYANVFVVTSSDLLLSNFAYTDNYDHLRNGLGISGDIYLSKNKEITTESAFLALQGGRIPVLSVHDGEPGLLDNIGSIVGTQQKCLAVRKTSKSGTTADIFHLHHLDSDGIVESAWELLEAVSKESFHVDPSII
ncbi:MAG: pyruvate dehydrogenase [Deltaproteobacteria bacterium]|nr:pyruvate dehydrogenase [Deltaproteobacteria bacterium]